MNLAFWFFTYMRTKKECVDPETDMSKSVVSRQECYEALHKVQSLTSTQSQLQFYMEVFCCKDGINEKGKIKVYCRLWKSLCEVSRIDEFIVMSDAI